jgi:transposase
MGNNDAVRTATWLETEMRDAGQADRAAACGSPFSGDFRTRFDLANRFCRREQEVSRRAACARGAVVSGVDPKPVIRRLAEQLNVHPEALQNCIRQAEADRGERGDRPTTEMIAENRLLVNEVLRAASAYFAAEIGQTRRSS